MARVSAVTFLLGTVIVVSGILVEAAGGGPVGPLSPRHIAGVRGGDIEDVDCQCYQEATLICDGADEANSCSTACEEEAGWWFCVPHDGPNGPYSGPMPEGESWNSVQGAEALPPNTPGKGEVALGATLNCASCWSCECVDVDGGKTCGDEDPLDPQECQGEIPMPPSRCSPVPRSTRCCVLLL